LTRGQDGGVRAGAEVKTGLNAGITSNILLLRVIMPEKLTVNRMVHCFTQQKPQQKGFCYE
jgi:hypothetical protein